MSAQKQVTSSHDIRRGGHGDDAVFPVTTVPIVGKVGLPGPTRTVPVESSTRPKYAGQGGKAG